MLAFDIYRTWVSLLPHAAKLREPMLSRSPPKQDTANDTGGNRTRHEGGCG